MRSWEDHTARLSSYVAATSSMTSQADHFSFSSPSTVSTHADRQLQALTCNIRTFHWIREEGLWMRLSLFSNSVCLHVEPPPPPHAWDIQGQRVRYKHSDLDRAEESNALQRFLATHTFMSKRGCVSVYSLFNIKENHAGKCKRGKVCQYEVMNSNLDAHHSDSREESLPRGAWWYVTLHALQCCRFRPCVKWLILYIDKPFYLIDSSLNCTDADSVFFFFFCNAETGRGLVTTPSLANSLGWGMLQK